MNIPEALADIDGVLASPSKDHDSADYARIVAEQVTRYKACIHRYAPPHSPYRHEADQHETMSIARGAPRMPGGAGPNDLLRGVLRALRADVEGGRLASFEEMVRADVYADLIAQGKGLLEGEHSRAATVLVGAALEDHVRKLAVKHQIQLDDIYGNPKKAAVLNAELRKVNAYAEAQRASIEAWQKLRNAAAHGHPGFEGTDMTNVALIAPLL